MVPTPWFHVIFPVLIFPVLIFPVREPRAPAPRAFLLQEYLPPTAGPSCDLESLSSMRVYRIAAASWCGAT